ncbi:MAG: acyl-CoA carboxylase subunit beta [Chloroflexi bacterium]|nr:acyl-CoA carboxylase subunit beta [Chloroflexota bacterium]
MSKTKELIEAYKAKRDKIKQMGDPKAIEQRHKAGQWSARERIDYFFDANTFTEIGLFVKHRTTSFGMDKREVPAEGVITGYGKVNGRPVVAIAEDFTAMAGTFGEYHGKKFARALEFAKDMGWPCISMNDSGGARLQEGMDTLEAYGWLFRAQILASGIVPQISLLMGPCLGGQAYHPVMQDFLIQCRHTGFMGIAGPAFVKTQIGEEITLEELSGWKAHAIKSGQTHIVVGNDKEALDACKQLLSFLPSNNKEKPPCVKTKDDPERTIPELDTIIPDNSAQPFDMLKLITLVVDDGCLFELLKDHAPNCIIGFARFNGRPAGIVANRSTYIGGVIDVDAADKMARFIRFCDLFSIPLISFQDCPGYMIGSEQDWKGILRHGAKLLYAWADATVPLISIMVRKSYAGAHYGMLDKSIGADLVFAWPTAQVTIVGAETAASVIFAKEIKEAENPKEVKGKRIQEYRELYENPYMGAERGYIDDIIMPSDTRKMINRALDTLGNKTVARPWRKYSNINL